VGSTVGLFGFSATVNTVSAEKLNAGTALDISNIRPLKVKVIVDNILAKTKQLNMGHLLKICLKPSEIRDAKCHNCTSIAVIWIFFTKQPWRCPR
jgi:hypothetical protein